MCWTELTRYAACGHYIRCTYPCPYQQDAYQSEPDFLTPCTMQEVPPANEDETGLCEKCVARGRSGGNATTSGSAAVNTTVSPGREVQKREVRSYKLITLPTAPELQDMVATARATVLSWARDFLGGGGERGSDWEDVFELEAAFQKMGDEGSDDSEGSDTSCKTIEMDMPPMPQSPFEDHPIQEEKRILSMPPSPPRRRPTSYKKHIIDKLRYMEDIVELASQQYEDKAWFREPTTGREICVELDGWYVVAACLQVSVEELHEMTMRLLEERATGSEEENDEN